MDPNKLTLEDFLRMVNPSPQYMDQSYPIPPKTIQRPMEREYAQSFDDNSRHQQLDWLMRLNPKKRKDLWQLYKQGLGQDMDLGLNSMLFGRATDNNSLRMNEMNYLPSGEWDRTKPEMRVPLPRRM